MRLMWSVSSIFLFFNSRGFSPVPYAAELIGRISGAVSSMPCLAKPMRPKPLSYILETLQDGPTFCGELLRTAHQYWNFIVSLHSTYFPWRYLYFFACPSGLFLTFFLCIVQLLQRLWKTYHVISSPGGEWLWISERRQILPVRQFWQRLKFLSAVRLVSSSRGLRRISSSVREVGHL